MIPKINGKLVLCFESDFDMDIVSRSLMCTPTASERWKDTRMNPITQQHNCGFWEIETGFVSTYDSTDVQKILYQLTHSKIQRIHDILQQYRGDAIYRFIVELSQDEFPAIMIDKELIADANLLQANIDIVLT